MTPYMSHRKRWINCKRCELHKQRRQIVLARGMVPAPILFIGEAPGMSEDLIGKPFIGPAGKLLDYIISMALHGQYDYAMTNLVACFPRKAKESGNHEPSEKYINRCAPRLNEFIRICRPRLVVSVGKLAKRYVHTYFRFLDEVEAERPGWLLKGEELGFVEIIHPAAILRLDISQRGLAIQRCIVTIEDAVERIWGESGFETVLPSK